MTNPNSGVIKIEQRGHLLLFIAGVGTDQIVSKARLTTMQLERQSHVARDVPPLFRSEPRRKTATKYASGGFVSRLELRIRARDVRDQVPT
jgi:hypothetical protein